MYDIIKATFNKQGVIMKHFVLIGLFCLFSSFAEGKTQTFMPENDLHLQQELFENSFMTENKFNSIIDELEQYYKPIVSELGGNLRIKRSWQDNTVNAQAWQSGKDWWVEMFGGLARHRAVTEDAFALVLCHELGHHLAGFPLYRNDRWAANEGNSDYFATQACAKRIFNNEPYEFNKTFGDKIGKWAKDYCDKQYRWKEGEAVCYRSIAAGISLAKVFAYGERIAPETRDRTVVSRTQDSHPQPQCRLDSYVSGAFCWVYHDDYTIPKNQDEAENNSCMIANGFSLSARPKCWFRE
jgi:hypothetical protein